MIQIRYWPKGQEREKLRDFFIQRWHDDYIVAHENIYRPEDLEVIVALDNYDIKGLFTFIVNNNELEIITLDSLIERQGTGSLLLDAAVLEGIKRSCYRLCLTTTNDNLDALGFYQRKGFQIIRVLPNTVEKSRSIKTSIPLMAENGIPIRDELRFEKKLNSPQFQDGGSA